MVIKKVPKNLKTLQLLRYMCIFTHRSLDQLTSPFRYRVLHRLKWLIVFGCSGFVRGVGILSEVWVSQGLFCCDSGIRIKIQHPLKQVDGWNNINVLVRHFWMLHHRLRLCLGGNLVYLSMLCSRQFISSWPWHPPPNCKTKGVNYRPRPKFMQTVWRWRVFNQKPFYTQYQCDHDL